MRSAPSGRKIQLTLVGDKPPVSAGFSGPSFLPKAKPSDYIKPMLPMINLYLQMQVAFAAPWLTLILKQETKRG